MGDARGKASGARWFHEAAVYVALGVLAIGFMIQRSVISAQSEEALARQFQLQRLEVVDRLSGAKAPSIPLQGLESEERPLSESFGGVVWVLDASVASTSPRCGTLRR